MTFETSKPLILNGSACDGRPRTRQHVRPCPVMSGYPDSQAVSGLVRLCPKDMQGIENKSEIIGRGALSAKSGHKGKALSGPDKGGKGETPFRGVPLPAPEHAPAVSVCPLLGRSGDE